MKAAFVDRRVLVECTILARGSALLVALINQFFTRFWLTEPFTKLYPGDTPSAPWEMPKPVEEATAEPVLQALDQATTQVDTLPDW